MAYAHRNITVPPLIAALKVMLLLGDAEDSTRGMTKIFNVDDEDDDDFGLSMKSSSKGRQSNEKLSDFAKHTLKQICSQEWVHNRCLQVRYYKLNILAMIKFMYFEKIHAYFEAIDTNVEFAHIQSTQTGKGCHP